MGTLNLTTGIVGYDDSLATNNPQQVYPNLRRTFPGIPSTNRSVVPYEIQPLAEQVIFSGARSLTYDGTTQFALTNVSSIAAMRYRLQWTGTGTAPGFRTSRTVGIATGNAVLTLNANQTVTLTASLGAVFGAVVVGDQVFIPGVSTGDSPLFNSLNEGFWTVLTANASTLVLGRQYGTVFQGATETVAVATADQIQFFSSSGVQVNDTLDLVAGFSAPALRSFVVQLVTAQRIEFVSSDPIGSETLIPGASSLAVYSSAKRLVYVESDSEIALKYNGATDESNRVTPWVPGDPKMVGIDLKVGTAYSLSIKNRSADIASVLVITIE